MAARKLVLQMQMSVDGFVGGPNGELDWVFPNFDGESEKWIVDHLGRAGAHLMGRVTYGDMTAHWPTSKEPVAPIMNDIPKVVFSNSLKEAPWGETRIVSTDIKKEVDQLKREAGGDLVAHGGARFARSLVTARLVDEYVLFLHPVALGRGLPIFSNLDEALALRLIDAKTFRTGLVVRTMRPK